MTDGVRHRGRMELSGEAGNFRVMAAVDVVCSATNRDETADPGSVARGGRPRQRVRRKSTSRLSPEPTRET